jgi:hypothetical protein
MRYCEAERITFTRIRPGRKNDNCFVEQKNYSIVRKTVGYMRHDTEQEMAVLKEIYGYLSLYTNFFQPNMRLVEKVRNGSKVKKIYDEPKTPYRRLLESPDVHQTIKDNLTATYNTLNPAELKRRISKLQDRLFKTYVNKTNVIRKEEANPDLSSTFLVRQ